MKLYAKIASIIIAIPICFALSACGSEQDTGSSAENNSSDVLSSIIENTSSGDTSSTESEVATPNEKHKYDSENLVFSHKAEAEQTSDPSKDYIKVDGLGEFELDSDGNAIIKGFRVSEFNGDIIYFFENSIGKNLVVFSLDSDGKVYLNSYSSDGSKDGYDNTLLVFKDVANDAVYEEIESISFKDTFTAGFFVKIDGKYYHNKIGSIARNDPYLLIYEIPECDAIFELGYRNPYSAVCYSKQDVDNAVFFYCGDKDYTVNLPEGYEISDIKQLSFGMTILVVMNDGVVCTVDADRNAKEHTLVINEEVTTLNKDGCVKKIYVSSYNQVCDVLVELDDGNVYKTVNE